MQDAIWMLYQLFKKKNSDSVMSHNTARKIRLSWKLIAVIRRNHTELVPEWNFAPVFKRPVTREISCQGEITPVYDEI